MCMGELHYFIFVVLYKNRRMALTKHYKDANYFRKSSCEASIGYFSKIKRMANFRGKKTTTVLLN